MQQSGYQAPQPIPPQSMPQGYPYPAYQQPVGNSPVYVIQQKRGMGWLFGLILVLLLLGAAAFGIYSCAGFFGGNVLSAPPHDESIAVIEMDGSIAYDGSVCSPDVFNGFLKQAEADSRIRAVVIRVNSGGGTAAAGEEMSKALADFEKPVVVSTAAINASAAYEITSQADYIYVAAASEVGGIGTAIELMDYSRLMDMLGIDAQVITSADSKDSSYGLRPLTEAEIEHYQHMVDQINTTFIERVAAGRNMSIDSVRALATGLTYTGIDAVQNGLADEIGTRDDALSKAAQLAGLSSYYVYEMVQTKSGIEDITELLGI